MSLLPVRFHPAAQRELERAVAYYDERVPELGDDLVTQVEHVIREVREHPELGIPHWAGTHRVLVRRFPYSIVYRVQAERIEVIAVAHHRRRPEYWYQRG